MSDLPFQISPDATDEEVAAVLAVLAGFAAAAAEPTAAEKVSAWANSGRPTGPRVGWRASATRSWTP